jgi:hypothetical protein
MSNTSDNCYISRDAYLFLKNIDYDIAYPVADLFADVIYELASTGYIKVSTSLFGTFFTRLK